MMNGDRVAYYRRGDVLRMSGAGRATIDRWAEAFEGTPLVLETDEGVLFSEDFLAFVESRAGKDGPSGLPAPARIAALYRLWRKHSGRVAAIARELGVNPITVAFQAKAVGLKE